MADATATTLLSFILEKLADEAFTKYVRSQGIHSELDNLGRELSNIQALLHDATQKQVTQKSVELWLNRLQHLAYDIDDVLDDVATEAMGHELIKESPGASTSKVRNLIVPTCCTNFSLSHKLSPKIDTLTTELQQLYKEKDNLGLMIVKDEKQKDPNRGNETSLLESGIVGREAEKEKLLNKLLGDDDDESSKENFSIVPIVGMGGVGKTTLARLLYNDTKVNDHFQLKAWVCVSDDFDILKISQTIFQDVSRESTKFEDLNQVQKALTEQFKDKRFLLVVDDVWTENYDHWEKLVRPLNSGASGSRVVMTTRKRELLNMLGFENTDLLQSLSSEGALSLFALHALGVDSFDSYPTLREKGEAIVKKCGTLPLALKAIGRLLRNKTKENWDDVLNSQIWNSKYVGDLSADWKAIFPALMVSYHDLSANLKRLFAYCSLFPKDFLFNKEELVLLWMAEGFLNHSDATKSQEEFGQDDFEALLSRSFFQHAPNDESLYVMHDLMNDLATFVAKGFSLRIENHTKTGNEDLTKYRHMSFIPEKYAPYQKFEPFKRARRLRTFLVVSERSYFSMSNTILADLLPQLPLLRVLSLSNSLISKVPDSIGSLKHLRYIKLSNCSIEKLPESIGNLFNLQTLILQCCGLLELPKSFLKLKKLRHFDLRGISSLLKKPLGIGKLKSLQTLTKIVIEGDDGFDITKLKGLNDLRGELSIKSLSNLQSAMHAHEAKLSLKGLTKLKLDYKSSIYGGERRIPPVEEVLKKLKLGSEWLKELSIYNYAGREFPKWVGCRSFHKLARVSIINCINCTSLPPLGHLPSLEELFIDGTDEVKFIGLDLASTKQVTVGAFPSLKYLKFSNMKGWEIWSTNDEVLDPVFPCLRKLEIEHCPKLIEVSLKTLPSLEILKFNDMSVWKGWLSSSEVSLLPCLRVLDVKSLPKLIEFSPGKLPLLEVLKFEDMLGWEIWSPNKALFPCLRELYINNCPKLIEFSPGKLPLLEVLQFKDMLGWEIWSPNKAVFPCLRELHINNCPKLIDVSAEELPLLRVLAIDSCGYGLLRSLVEAASSITELDISSISGLTYEVWRGVMGHLGAVEEVTISKCDEIRYLWESEEEASEVLVNIKKLKVFDCSNLVSLREKEEVDNFGSSLWSSLRVLEVRCCDKMVRCCSPNSIESLTISFCRSLTNVSFPKTTIGGGGQNLKSLCIWDCNKLMEKINNTSMSVLESIYIIGWTNLKSIMQLGNFIYLTELHINDCPSIESFPNIQLPVLTCLEIVGCESMESFSAHQMTTNLPLLKDLKIRDCPSIDAPGIWPPNLCSLEIERLKKPMSEWGRQIFATSLVSLKLYDEPHVSNFGQLSHLSIPSSLTELQIESFDKLKSLSMGLEHLTSLQHLHIIYCPKMKHLPKNLLPSLLSLTIFHCPNLRKRCEGRGSHYYPLISHIPKITIG